MVCEKCGAINRDSAVACIVCGHRFTNAGPAPVQQRNPWADPNNIVRNPHIAQQPSVPRPGPGQQYPQSQQPMYGRQPIQGQQPVQGQHPVQGQQPIQGQQPAQGQQPVPDPGQPQMPQIQYVTPNGRAEKSLKPLIGISVALAVLIVIASIIVILLAHSVQKNNTGAVESTGTTVSVIQNAADDTEEGLDPDAQAYAEAEQLEADGSYREAADAFTALGGYQDSADRAAECTNYADYYDALADLEAGDKEEAAEIFTGLGDFEDSLAQLAKCGLDLPDAAVEEMDAYFRDTLEDTFNGSDWQHDTLSEMEYLGRYELVSKDGDSSDNYVYLLYKVTGSNNAAGSMTYYWFGCYEDVTVSGASDLSYSDRICFTNGAGNEYRLYINGSSSYYYYGFETINDFESDQISDLLEDYYSIWIPAE